jgi:hypothetical protein
MSRCVRADHPPSGTEPPGACVQALARRCAAAHALGHRASPHPIGLRGRRVLFCPAADHERQRFCCVGRCLGAGHLSGDRFEVCLVGSSCRFFPAGMQALGAVAAAARSGGAGAGDDAEPRRHDVDGERFEPVAARCPEPSRQPDVGLNGSRCHRTSRPVTRSRSAFRSQHRQLPAATTFRGAWCRNW